jgi:hypothetical protein
VAGQIQNNERVMNLRFTRDSNSLLQDPLMLGENQRRTKTGVGQAVEKTLLTALVGAALSLGITASASADTVWQSHHSRREEVNNRLTKLNHRIGMERGEGEMSAKRAHQLRAEDRTIRAPGALRCGFQ